MTMRNKDRADGRRDTVEDAARVSYVPATPGDWTSGDPGNVADALDEARETGGAALDAHIADSTDPHGSQMTVSVAVTSVIFRANAQLNLQGIDGNVAISANGAVDRTVIINNGGAGRADLNVDRNIILGGTVDGRDVAADGTKLDTIQAHEVHYSLLAVGAGVVF